VKSGQATGNDASKLIDQRIRDLGDWRGDTLAHMRALILAADPEMIEEWKWMGTPVWSHHGIVCTGESYKKVVKLTFAKGAFLPDPTGLFNSSMEGNMRRAIDIPEGVRVDDSAFKALIKAAVEHNSPPASSQKAIAKKPAAKPAAKKPAAKKPAAKKQAAKKQAAKKPAKKKPAAKRLAKKAQTKKR
jgi:hypothetical protein